MRGRERISTKEALKNELSYNKAKQHGIKIRKQYYLTLKKLVRGDELTNSQKKANEEMKRSTKWKKLRDWAEEEGKKKYVKAEGTVVISGSYVAIEEKRTKGEKRRNRVYFEYVINAVAYADTGENAEEIAESTLTHAFRKVVLDFLKDSELREGTVREVRAELQDDWEYTKVKDIKENEANILEESFVIEKWNGREYDYTEKITTKFKNILGDLEWKAE
jgi:hypothetical protein